MTRECQCEHVAHFAAMAGRHGWPHVYGAVRECAEVVTVYGRYQLCARCAEVCHADPRAREPEPERQQ